MLSIDSETWERIESQVRALMIAAFDAGFDAGTGAPQRPARDPALGQLLDDTRRHWADGLASMHGWRRAYALPPLPDWLEDL